MADKAQGENNGGFKVSQWWAYFIAIGIPLALAMAWHSINSVYPNDDCANYFETAQDIYQRFKQGGFIDGLWASYTVRGWRPLIFPLMALPFIAISRDNILFSVAATLLSLYFVFLTYAYLTAREFLSPWRAALCTVFIGTIPWLVNFAFYFMSEMALMACSMAAIYHLKKADLFASRRQSILAAVWLGLGFAVRPVEFTLAFGLLASVLIYLSWRKGIISRRDIAATLAVVFLMLALFLAAAKGWVEHRPALRNYGAALLLVSALPLIFKKRWKLHAPYQWAVFICNMMIIVWWLPYMKNLYDWIQETTGVVGQLYHDRGQMGFFKAVYAFFSNLGGWPLIITLGLFALGILAARQTRRETFRSFLTCNAAAISMIVPPVFMLSMTTDIAYRRAFAGFSVLLLVNAVFAARQEMIFSRLRILVFSMLTVSQVFLVYTHTYNLYPGITRVFVKFFEAPGTPHIGGDPSQRFFAKLMEYPFKGHVEIAALSLSQTQYGERPFDTSALNLVAKKEGSDVRFSYPAVFFSLQEGYALLHKNWEYAILDVSTGNPADDPYSRLTADIIEKWKQNRLMSIGLAQVTEFHTTQAWINDWTPPVKTVLLLEILKNRTAIENGVEAITASSNLFPSEKGMRPISLMETNQTIWHAQSPPKYPEWIEVDYYEPKRITQMALRAQDDSKAGDEHQRGPKNFVLQASSDKTNWKDIFHVKGNAYTSGGQWKQWEFANSAAYRYYRIYITSGGNPNYLTLTQIRLLEISPLPVNPKEVKK